MSRVLPVLRYSGEDEAGALDRQRAALDDYIAESDHVVADGPNGGWVEDETVSGSIHLDERKSLGQWLREPLLHRWDVMVVTTQDRITRDDMHWWQFVGRLSEWGKRLVVLDDPQLDLSTPNGRMIAGIKATQAANYRQDVQKKLLKAREDFRKQRRYAGGHWPFGYRSAPREGAEGWQLIPDPESSRYVLEAVERVLAGESLKGICRDWTERGVPTARQHQAMTRPLSPGEERGEIKQYAWNETTLRRVLESPAILGYASHKGEVLREDGLPVQWADPIVSGQQYRDVLEAISKRARRGLQMNRSPLLGVLYCADCGRVLHTAVTKGHRYYRCASANRGKGCGSWTLWPVQMMKDYIEDEFLTLVGDEPIRRRQYTPGENYSDEIVSLKDAIENLSGNLANLPTNSRAVKSVMEKIAQHEQRLDELERNPETSGRYDEVDTGETYRQRWEALSDWNERGAWLFRSGFWAEIGGHPKTPNLHLHTPNDVTERLQQST